MTGLNSPVGGGQKLARFLGMLLVQAHGKRTARRASLVFFSLSAVADDRFEAERCFEV